MVDLQLVLLLALLLFLIGLAGAVLRRNIFVVLIGIELMLNAVNLTFIALARQRGDLQGQGFAFLVVALAAAEAAVGLAIVVALFRARKTLRVDQATLLKH